MTRRNGPRFNDSKDFDDVHDAIMADVIGNPIKYIERTFGSWPIKTQFDSINNYKLDREQRFQVIAEDEFWGAYPDIRIDISVVFNHYIRLYHTIKDDPRSYWVECETCEKKFGDILFRIENDKINNLINSIGAEEAKDQLWKKAFDIAYSRGLKDVSDPGGMFHREFEGHSASCFTLKYFLFIEIKSHIKSFGETLRQLRIYKSLGEQHSWKPKSQKVMDIKQFYYHWYSYGEEPIFKGVYLLTPDLRFREEFESQGFPVIPFEMPEGKKMRRLDDFGAPDNYKEELI